MLWVGVPWRTLVYRLCCAGVGSKVFCGLCCALVDSKSVLVGPVGLDECPVEVVEQIMALGSTVPCLFHGTRNSQHTIEDFNSQRVNRCTVTNVQDHRCLVR